MNLPFPILLIALLILPGLFFSLAFFATEERPLNYVPFTRKVAFSLIITFIIHLLWVFLAQKLNYPINLNTILTLASGAQNELYSGAVKKITSKNIYETISYFLTIYIAAFLLGKMLRWIIKKSKFDKIWKFLRIDSPWFYLFTGYDWEDGKPDGVMISAAVELAGQGYLYRGFLENFFLDESGDIDRLVLTSSSRRKIENDKPSNTDTDSESLDALKRFYPIDGNYFVLKYSEIKSLNIQFLKLEEMNNLPAEKKP